jgi:hypothetical protein
MTGQRLDSNSLRPSVLIMLGGFLGIFVTSSVRLRLQQRDIYQPEAYPGIMDNSRLLL